MTNIALTGAVLADRNHFRDGKWEQVKQQAANRYYERKREGMEKTNEQTLEGLIIGMGKVIKDFNNWLKNGKGQNTEHPYNVFVYWVKNHCKTHLTTTAMMSILPSTIQVTYDSDGVQDIIFFDNGWPQWHIKYLDMLREASKIALSKMGSSLNITSSNVPKNLRLDAHLDNLVDQINQFSFS
jgi:hypothetical protein